MLIESTAEMTDPPASVDPELEAKFQLQQKCDDEFARFEKHRAELIKGQLEGEKNYDTLLVALSTLAIGSSFTIVKDITKGNAAPLMILAWVALACCLFAALVDRLLTYAAHRRTREVFDEEFSAWSEGAWARAENRSAGLWHNRVLDRLKWVCFGSLALGVLFLMMSVFVGWQASSSTPTSPPVIINVYNGSSPTTAPTTQETYP